MMLIATLLTNPRKADLDGALVESLRKDWSGGDVVWLDRGVAAQFSIPSNPTDFSATWAALQEQETDLLITSAEGRRKKLLIADMDSTMIEQECIDELAAEAGVGAEVAAITREAMNGALDFEGALNARVALLRGLPEATIAEVIRTRITHMPGGRALVATMKANGAHAALISGGFTAFTAHIAKALGFDTHQANQLEIERGQLTGRVIPPILGKQAKLEALEAISARLGFTPKEAIAVGDGANDLAMLGRAGMGVALHAKPSVQAACSLRVNYGDLTALLYIQGYRRADFVAV